MVVVTVLVGKLSLLLAFFHSPRLSSLQAMPVQWLSLPSFLSCVSSTSSTVSRRALEKNPSQKALGSALAVRRCAEELGRHYRRQQANWAVSFEARHPFAAIALVFFPSGSGHRWRGTCFLLLLYEWRGRRRVYRSFRKVSCCRYSRSRGLTSAQHSACLSVSFSPVAIVERLR